jgi:DNA repair protein RecN (Recombination protein N)
LGSRADIKTQSEWSEKTVVEGEFALNHDQFGVFFSDNDIDFEEVTIIRREINNNGKSRTFINDTPVNLNQLKSLGEKLISIHSQHENTHLNDRVFQFNLIDNFAGIFAKVSTYKKQFKSLKEKETKLTNLKTEQDKLLKEKDYLEFLINEFEVLALQENEESNLETELNVLGNAEQITQIADWISNAITDSENAIADVLTQIRNKIRTIENVNDKSRELSLQLSNLKILPMMQLS